MNFSRVSSPLTFAAFAASIAMTLAACGSDSETTSATTAPITDEVVTAPLTETTTVASPCPTGAPEDIGAPDWTLPGTTGNVAVTGPTDTTAPSVDVEGPFSVTETQVHTLQAADGPVVADSATVSVCYMGVNGRDGTVFDSSYEGGAPVDFALGAVIPGFQKAIAGQNVGSTVAVAMTSADGYPEGEPSAGIEPGDSLIFAIKILDAAN